MTPSFSSDIYGQNPDFSQTGMSVSQYHYTQNQIRIRNMQKLHQQLMMSDPNVQMMADMFSRTTGAPITQNMLVGLGMFRNSGLGKNLFGSSVNDLFQGLNAGVINSGYIQHHRGGEMLGMYGGAGALSGQAALDLTKMIDQNFFPGGAARYDKTMGFDRGQIGQMAAQMAMGGMYAGALSTTQVGGQTRFDASSKQRVQESIEQGARMLSSLREILGSSSVARLMDAANGLAGARIGSTHQLATAQQRIFEIQNLATISGANPAAILSQHQTLLDSYRNAGMPAPIAAQAAMGSVQAMALRSQSDRTAQRNFAEMGIYLPDNTQGAAMSSAMDQTSLLNESPRLGNMLLAIQEGQMSDADRSRLMTRFRGLSQAGSRQSLMDATNALHRDIVQTTGVDMGYWNRLGGVRSLSQENIGVMRETSQARDRVRQVRSMENLLRRGHGDRAGVMSKAFSQYSMDTLSKAASGDAEAMARTGLSAREAKAVVLAAWANPSHFGSFTSAEDQARADETLYQNALAEAEYGGDPVQSGEGVRGLIGGLMGVTNITDLHAKDYLNQTGETGVVVDEKDKARILAIRKAGGVLARRDGKLYAYDPAQIQDAKNRIHKQLQKKRAENLGLDTSSEASYGSLIRNQVSEKLASGDFDEEYLDKLMVHGQALSNETRGIVLEQLRERISSLGEDSEERKDLKELRDKIMYTPVEGEPEAVSILRDILRVLSDRPE